MNPVILKSRKTGKNMISLDNFTHSQLIFRIFNVEHLLRKLSISSNDLSPTEFKQIQSLLKSKDPLNVTLAEEICLRKLEI